MTLPGRDAVGCHEVTQKVRMLLFLADQKLRNSRYLGGLVFLCEAVGRAQQIASGGLLSQLKSCDGRGDELPLRHSQDVGNAVRDVAWVLGVVLEMIEPDFQIREHGAALVVDVSHSGR